MIKSGKFSTFKKINDTQGIKSFETKEICDYAFWAQSEAYKIGCATKVIERLNDTQILVEIADTEWIENNLQKGIYYCSVFKLLASKLEPILCSKKRPTKKGKPKKYLLDFHHLNLGMYQNKIVCLDFS